MNRRLHNFQTLKKNALVVLAFFAILSSVFGQADTTCATANQINTFQSTLFSDTARWHVFTPPSNGTIEITTCNLGFTEYTVVDGCITGDTCCVIDSLSIMTCNNGTIETYPTLGNDPIYIEVLAGDGLNDNRVNFEYIPENICPGDSPIPLLCNSPIDTSTLNGLSKFNALYYTNCINIENADFEYSGADLVFEFRQPTDSENIFFKLSNMTDNLDLFLFDNLCNILGTNVNCMAANTEDNQLIKTIGPLTLQAGTYYIIVDGWSNTTAGNFTLEATCPDCDYTGPDFTAGPDLLCSSVIFDSTIISNNAFHASDYSNCYNGPKSFDGQDNLYILDLPTMSSITSFTLNNLEDDFDMFLFDSNFECVEASITSGTSSEMITLQNTVGRFYLVVDSDNCGIASDFSISIGCDCPLSININQAEETVCENDVTTITAIANLGNGPYTFTWSDMTQDVNQSGNSSIDVSTGMHCVTVVDNSNCRRVQCIDVEDSGTPFINALEVTPASCLQDNGMITVDVVGDFNNTDTIKYSLDSIMFQTSNVFTDLSTGVYTVYVTNTNGCANLDETIVDDVPPPSITTVQTTLDSCRLGMASITILADSPNGGLLYSLDGVAFQVSNTFDNLMANSYTVSVIDNSNCVVSQLAEVMATPAAQIEELTIAADTCGNSSGQITVITSGGEGTILYSLDNEIFQASPVFSLLPGGTYDIFVTDDNNCTATDQAFVPTLGAPEIIEQVADTSGCAGDEVLFFVNAILEGDGNISYQWQALDNDIWLNINNPSIYSGEQTDTLRISDITGLNEQQYRVLLSSEFCNQDIISAAATLRVDGPLSIVQSPTNQGLCSGFGTSLTVEVASNNPQANLYQWELSTNSGVNWSNLPNGGLYSGSNSDTLQISDISNLDNFMYRVTVFTDFCESITSESALLQVERPMSITAQPNNFNVCSGENVAFSFTINSNGFDNPQFQWQVNTDGGDTWTDIMDDEIYMGTSSTTLNISNVEGLNDYLYRAAVIGDFCEILYTNPAVLRVTGQVAISDQPDNTTVCVGESASFSFSTGNTQTDESFDIQWEVSINNGQNFSPISDDTLYIGTTTTTLLVTNVDTLNNYRFRVSLFSDNCEPSISEAALLTVAGPLSIDTEPITTTVCAGQNASFSAIASNNGAGGLIYNWQTSTDGQNWTNLENNNVFNGVQTANLSISNTFGLNNNQFRLIVGNEVCPSISSQAATLITEGPISFSDNPQNIAVCNDGNSVSFSAIAINQGTGNVNYQWEMSNGTGFSSIGDNGNFNGMNNTTLTIIDITSLDGEQFRLSASTPLCPPVYSNPATLTIEGPISIISQAQDVMSCSGEAVTFNVEATAGAGGNLAYQWQINNGGNWANLQNNNVYNGTTTNTLSIANTNNLNGSQYRAIIVTPLCIVPMVSDAANLTVQGEVSISNHPENSILCASESTTFSTATTISGETSVTYQWQISTNNGMNWIDLSNQSPYNGVTTTTLMVDNINGLNTYQYRAKIFNESCTELFTNAAILTVEGPLAIISQPLAMTACSGSSATFQVDAANAGAGSMSYQWYISTNNGENYFELLESNFNYNGTTSPSLNVLNTIGLDGALFRVEVNTPNCPIITSQDVMLTVEGPISITNQPQNQEVCDDGTPIIFSAMVENENSGSLNYQWETATDGTTFTAIANNANYSGVDSPTLTVQNSNDLNGFQYRLVTQTNTCLSLVSNIASLAVRSPSIQTINIVEDTCGLNNGALSILAEGGFGNLLYSLDNNNFQTSAIFGNLASANYTIFVQDENNCTVSQDANVPSFSAPEITNIEVIPDTCDRQIGALIITAMGNTNDLLYSINGTDFQAQNTFNNLSVDTYTVFVTDGFNCMTQMTASITEAAGMLSLDLDFEENSGANPNDGITCTGEEVTLNATASGGNDDYTYDWNNGLTTGGTQTINPLASNTYIVTATDGNLCFAIDSISIIVQESAIASTNSNSPICEGEAIIFSAAGGTIYNWTGPNGFTSSAPNPTIPNSTGADAGTYTLTINNQNNCSNTTDLDVTVIGPSNYPAMVSVLDDFICEGDDDETVRLTGNLYPEIEARGVWFTDATGVEIDGVVTAEATAINLNYGANTFIWALSNETCDEFSTDSVTVFLEPIPVANNDTLSSFENVPIDSFSVILNDNVENLIEWEIDLVKQPERAEVTYLGNGKFSVLPEETFFGELRFSYRLFSMSCNRFVEADVIINIEDNKEAIHCVWTPQTDGFQWELCRAISPNNTIRILDRYGKLVHSASPYLHDWDGTNIETGQPVPTGTYYFVLTQNKETEVDDEILGTLILLR